MARRLVRQDTPLWSALHRGCLTGGHLNAALGFYEPACARKLGMPASFVGHQRLLAAYGNLLQRPHGAVSDVFAAPGRADRQCPLQGAADARRLRQPKGGRTPPRCVKQDSMSWEHSKPLGNAPRFNWVVCVAGAPGAAGGDARG